MSETSARISVVVPHLNQHDHLVRCLRSLQEQSEARRILEIIVVDNGSTVLPVDICAAFENVRLVEEETPGPGPARNKGIAVSKGDILAFIDADCIADPGWIAAIDGALGADGADTVLGGDVRIALGDPKRLTVLEAYESIFAYRQKEYIEKQGFSGTGNLAMRRETFDRVGPFAGIHVSEDRDWGRRAGRAGLAIVYLPGMIVYHPARTSFLELYAKWDRHIDHDFEDSIKKPFGRVRWVVYALAVAASPVFELRRIALSPRISGMGAKLMAGLGLIRIRAHRAWRMSQLLLSGAETQKSRSWNRT